MATKRRKPSRPKLSRPDKWWREPIEAYRLRGLSDEEKAEKINAARALKVAQISEAIRDLRLFTSEFSAESGYSLHRHKVARLKTGQIKKIQREILKLRDAQSRPHLVVTPRGDRQRKSVKQVAGELFKGQKRFIVHVPTTENVTYKFVDGRLMLETKAKGVNLFKGYYFFPRKPRSWDDVLKMTRDIMRVGMISGLYKVYNSVYGEIGEAISRDRLLDELENIWASYNQYLAGTILGFIWRGSDYKQAERKGRELKTTIERYKEIAHKRKLARDKRIRQRLRK